MEVLLLVPAAAVAAAAAATAVAAAAVTAARRRWAGYSAPMPGCAAESARGGGAPQPTGRRA